jgi:hypothetical protein
MVDWDALGRTQTIEVRDAATDALLDTRDVSTFSGGQYLVWRISGPVRLRVLCTGGPNAVVSAVFLDPVP